MNAAKLEIIGGTDYEAPLIKPDYKGEDPYWLNNQPLMTFVLVQQANSKNPMLGQFCVADRKGDKKATLLVQPNGEKTWVDPKDFSRAWNLHTVLITAEEFETMDRKGELDGRDYLSIPSGDADTATPE